MMPVFNLIKRQTALASCLPLLASLAKSWWFCSDGSWPRACCPAPELQRGMVQCTGREWLCHCRDEQPDRELLLQAKPAAYKQPTWCAVEHNPAIGQLNGWSS